MPKRLTICISVDLFIELHKIITMFARANIFFFLSRVAVKVSARRRGSRSGSCECKVEDGARLLASENLSLAHSRSGLAWPKIRNCPPQGPAVVTVTSVRG